MTKYELQKRLVKITGQAPHSRAIPKNLNRRGENFVETESDYEGDEFDDFFNFEEDLADMEAARRQVERLEMEKIKDREAKADKGIKDEEDEDKTLFFVLEEFNQETKESGNEDSFFTFEEYQDLEPKLIEEDSKKKYNDVIGFEFRYCSFIKKDGNRCKRQSPKESEYCGTHRKYIERHSK